MAPVAAQAGGRLVDCRTRKYYMDSMTDDATGARGDAKSRLYITIPAG